jgi:molecular chaperone GrpE
MENREPVDEQMEGQEMPEAEQAVSPEQSEVEILKKEITLLESQLRTMRDRYVRAMADLDNARKRARHELAEAQVHAQAGVLLDVLNIVDNFERALESMAPGADASPETKAIYEGVSLIYRQLVDTLARRGVKAIEAVGKPFDTHRHEAVVQVPTANSDEDGVVALETQRGYTFGDRVLRPAKVGVAVREEERGEKRENNGESG